ncbi:ABC transporter substrate-binding protein [Microbacter sp. ANSKLAB05]|nr:ABC transporter substrate-binding protein [Microbacter sp. ANSKLAB05]
MRHSRITGLVAAAAAVSLVAACGQGGTTAADGSTSQETGNEAFGTSGPAPEGEPQSGGTIRWAYATEPVSVDSANCGASMSWMACTAIYGSLVTFDPRTLEYGPGLAETFDSEDGRTWTITLRPDLTFSDGTPLDAEAVAFNWERAADPVNRNPSRDAAESMEWEVVDDRTIQVTLAEPNFQFPTQLYTGLGMIGSPTAIKERGEDFARNPVGAGPFELESWSRGTEMSFVRNDDYWDAPRPYLDELAIVVIPQEQQRSNALTSGDVDINTTGMPRTAEELRAAGMSESHMVSIIGAGLRFNMASGPTADPRVRQAIGHAIDLTAVREAAWSTGPSESFANEGGVLYDPEVTNPEHDPELAQKLVDEIRAENGGEDIVVEYLSLAGVSQMVQEGQMLKAQVGAIDGLTLNVVDVDPTTFSSRILGGNFEATMGNIGVQLDPSLLYDRMHSGGGMNSVGYSNPEFDSLIDAARTTPEVSEQVENYKAAMAVLAGDLGTIPWTPATTYWFHNGNVGGITPGYDYYLRPDLLWISE